MVMLFLSLFGAVELVMRNDSIIYTGSCAKMFSDGFLGLTAANIMSAI